MTYKSFYKDKRKFVSVPILIILSAFFWPLLIGGLLIFLAMRYIPSGKVKYLAIGVIVLIALPVGTGWFLGMTGGSSSPEQVNKEDTSTTTEQSIPSPTSSPTPSPTPTVTPTPEIISTPVPTERPYIQPTKIYFYPTPTKFIPTNTPLPTTAPAQNIQQQSQTSQNIAPPVQQSSGGFSCNCSKTCPQISSCAEAQYLLNSCGCSARDGDNDGTACDGAPLHCQN